MRKWWASFCFSFCWTLAAATQDTRLYHNIVTGTKCCFLLELLDTLQVNSLKHFCTPLITKRMLQHKNTPTSQGILNDCFLFIYTQYQHLKRGESHYLGNICKKTMAPLRIHTLWFSRFVVVKNLFKNAYKTDSRKPYVGEGPWPIMGIAYK